MTNTARPEDAVACPACAKAPGDACDGPMSHPSRRIAHGIDAAPIGKFEREIAAAHTPGQPQRHFATPVIHRDVPGLGDAGSHRPTLARTLMEGPGNKTRIRGCSCGAHPMTPEAFAEHVGMPVAAVQALLDLAGIVYDLIDHHGHAKMQREAVIQRLAQCLEFQT